MATEYTQWYNLDKYVGSDKPNLLDQYNSSMEKIDSSMRGLQNQINNTVGINVIDELVNRIDALDDYAHDTLSKIGGYYNVIDYGADATGQTSSYQAILDTAQAASGKGYVYFPSGTYTTDFPIDLSIYDHFGVIGDGAILTTDSNLSYLICPGLGAGLIEHKPHFHNMQGMILNGNNKVQSGVLIRHHMHMHACNFTGFLDYCISPDSREQNASQGCRISDCSFYNIPTDTPNCVAMHIVTDSFIDQCRFWGYRIGIEAEGANIYNNLYFWNLRATYPVIGIKTPSHIGTAKYSNIEFDTINKPCVNSSGSFVNCSFLYNGDDVQPSAQYYCVLDDDSNGLRTPLAYFNGCTFRTINSFNVQNLTPFNNKYRRIEMDCCEISNYDVFDNQLYELSSTHMKKEHETIACSNAGTWYKIASAYYNQPYSHPFYINFRLSICDTGRCADVYFNWSNTVFEVKAPYDTNLIDLSANAEFAIIKDDVNQKVDFYVKPKTASLTTLQIDVISKSLFCGSFVLCKEETTLTDSDMTTVINS